MYLYPLLKISQSCSARKLFSHHKQVHTSACKQKCVQAPSHIKTFKILKLVAR